MAFGDFSSNNGSLNIKEYAKKRHWISLKRTEGTGYKWTESDKYVQQAHDYGLHVIHYHWLRPDQNVSNQANAFLNAMNNVKPGDLFMIDYEATARAHDPSPEDRAHQLRVCMETVSSAVPMMPGFVYTGNWYLDGKPDMQVEVRRYPVVMSNYSLSKAQRTLKRIPNPYKLNYWILQYSDTVSFPGVSGKADANVWLREPRKLFGF